MTNTSTATPGVSRQIRPNRMPKRPRRPTAHQLSAKTSLRASPRALAAAMLPFPDAVLAAMGQPPPISQVNQYVAPNDVWANRLGGNHEANMGGKAPRNRSCPHRKEPPLRAPS